MEPWPFSFNSCKQTRDAMKLHPSSNEPLSVPAGRKSANRIAGLANSQDEATSVVFGMPAKASSAP